MTLDYEFGKIYDVIMAVNFHFNYEYFKEIYEKEGSADPEKYFKYYDEIKENLDFISDQLFPLFYHNFGKISPVSKYFLYKTNKETINFDRFLDIIEDDNIFKKFLFNYIFEAEIDLNNTDCIYEKISQISANGDYKFDLLNLIHNYNNIKNDLILTLKKIYPLVSELHERNTALINSVFNTTNKDETKDKYVKYWNIDKKRINNFFVGYSLINTQITYYDPRFDMTQILFGIDHLEEITSSINKKDISYRKFVNACSNDIKFEILEALHENGEMTKAQLSDLLDVSSSSISRYVDELFSNSMLIISKHESVKIFFSVNKEYFKEIGKSYNNFIYKLSIGKRPQI